MAFWEWVKEAEEDEDEAVVVPPDEGTSTTALPTEVGTRALLLPLAFGEFGAELLLLKIWC